MCKSADLLLMVLDATKPHTHKEILTRELESVGIRLNRSAPNIYFKKKKTVRKSRTPPITFRQRYASHCLLLCINGFHLWYLVDLGWRPL